MAGLLEVRVSGQRHAHVASEPSRFHGGGHVGKAGKLCRVLWDITLGEHPHDEGTHHKDQEHRQAVESRRRVNGCARYLIGGAQDGQVAGCCTQQRERQLEQMWVDGCADLHWACGHKTERHTGVVSGRTRAVRVQVARRHTHAWLERWQVHRSEGGTHYGRKRKGHAGQSGLMMDCTKHQTSRITKGGQLAGFFKILAVFFGERLPCLLEFVSGCEGSSIAVLMLCGVAWQVVRRAETGEPVIKPLPKTNNSSVLVRTCCAQTATRTPP